MINSDPARSLGSAQLSTPAQWRDVPWLKGLRRVPADASWPRFMSPPHPRAVGSLGEELERQARERTGRELRWWQRLAARRILEVDDAGELCWLEWLLSLARQGGKSWLLRELAMWRLRQQQRLAEPQLVMHVGNKLINASEVQAPARAWAKARRAEGWQAYEQAGRQEVATPDGDRWRCFAQASVYGFSAGLALVDEAWEIEAGVVENGIEPVMAERRWPQLGIISTAHPEATSLVIDRRRVALLPGATGLIIEWSAPPWLPLDDRSGWRAACPSWSAQRELLAERAYRKAIATRTSRLDELDPVDAFRCQYLNLWPDRLDLSAAFKGSPLLADGVWAQLEADLEIDGPITFAIEDNAGVSVAIAAAGRTVDDRISVEAYSLADRRLGYEWVTAHAEQHPGSCVLVGTALQHDSAVLELQCRVEVMALADTRQALSLLRQVAARRGVAHSGSGELAEQLDGCRVADGTAGLRVTSPDRWDLVRAAAWCVAAVERERRSVPSVY
jgi:hypothetical protein